MGLKTQVKFEPRSACSAAGPLSQAEYKQRMMKTTSLELERLRADPAFRAWKRPMVFSSWALQLAVVLQLLLLAGLVQSGKAWSVLSSLSHGGGRQPAQSVFPGAGGAGPKPPETDRTRNLRDALRKAEARASKAERQLAAELQSGKSTTAAMQSQISSLQHEVATLSARLTQLQASYDKLKGERQGTRSTLADSTSAVLKVLQYNHLDSAKGTLESLEAQSAAMRREIAALSTQRSELQASLRSLMASAKEQGCPAGSRQRLGDADGGPLIDEQPLITLSNWFATAMGGLYIMLTMLHHVFLSTKQSDLVQRGSSECELLALELEALHSIVKGSRFHAADGPRRHRKWSTDDEALTAMPSHTTEETSSTPPSAPAAAAGQCDKPSSDAGPQCEAEHEVEANCSEAEAEAAPATDSLPSAKPPPRGAREHTPSAGREHGSPAVLRLLGIGRKPKPTDR